LTSHDIPHGNSFVEERLSVAQITEQWNNLLHRLRDYRFYADDLMHPNAQAISYIWEKFGAVFFSPQTQAKAQATEKEQKRQAHRDII